MSVLARLLDLLPAPYSAAPDAILSQLLNALALELEVLQEDLEKLAALVGIARLPWESLVHFRARLLPLVEARLSGAVAPGDIREFVYDYLSRAEQATGATLLPGLRELTLAESYEPPADRPLLRPLALVENPARSRRSNLLLSKGGLVPYLYRWTERNAGLEEASASFAVTGLSERRTAVPILVNLTTGDLLGYADALAGGRTVVIRPAGQADDPRAARATIDGADLTEKLFSVSGFQLGVPFELDDLDPAPRLPRLARGDNDWIFLSVGLYDVRGLNRFFFAIADEQLREAVFDETFFDHSLFPSGPVARLQMEWTEVEPASFEVRVPRYLVIEPAGSGAGGARPYQQVGEALAASVQELRAAGVRAETRFEPFVEVQPQRPRAQLPWVVIEPERASAGRRDEVSLGARFGESGLGEGRLE